MAEGDVKQTVFVIGLGVMGGSLAGALRRSGNWHVIGRDTDAVQARWARETGLVDETLDDPAEGVRRADLIVLATPILTIIAQLEEFARMGARDVVVMDLGSTKRRVCAAMEHLPIGWEAVGGHPMTGMRTAGTPDADAEIFRGRRFVLTPTSRTGGRAEETARRVLADLDAIAVRMDAAAHDRAVALVSHLPHFVSLPLLGAVADAGDEQAWALAAGGFRTIARSAADNPPMWIDIALTNGDFIAEALFRFARQAETLADAMAGGEEALLRALSDEARSLFERRLG